MQMRRPPGAAREDESEKEQEQETDHAENEVQSRRSEKRARAGGHSQGPDKIARARAEPDLPRRPKAAPLRTRQQRPPDHLRVDRSRRPGDRPTKDQSVNDRRSRQSGHR